MNKTEIPVTFISYLHSGRGFMSLSFRNTMPTKEMIDFLTGMEAAVGDDEIPLQMRLGEVTFRGFIKSVISRKSNLVLTVHVAPSSFLVSRFFNLVGKTGLMLTISRFRAAEEKENIAKPGRLSEDYLLLRNRVSGNLNRVSEATGRGIAEVIYDMTTFRGRDGVERKGVRSLEEASPGQLRYMDMRLEAMLKGKTQESNTY